MPGYAPLMFGRRLLWWAVRLVEVCIAVVVVAVTTVLKAALTLWGVGAGIAKFVLGGWLRIIPGLRSGGGGVTTNLFLFVVHYLAFWAAVWWLQWCGLTDAWDASATWFVDSRAGLQTALQVLPATIVAILVFALGAIFVVAQLAITAYGQRAAVLLGLDGEVHTLIVRPVVLGAGALLLAGQVPDRGDPSSAVTAAVATLVIATVVMIFASAATLGVILSRYTAPRGFPLHVVDPVGNELADGSTDLVVLRGPLLGEALKLALRRGDTISAIAILEAYRSFVDQYLAALQVQPSVRSHTTDDGSERQHWLAEDVVSSLVSAGGDGLKFMAPETDVQAVGRTLGGVAENFMRAGEDDDARICMEGLIELGTSSHQITPGGAVNFYGQPAAALAALEAVAEALGKPDLAEYALAGWLLTIAYPAFHFRAPRHPEWDWCIQALGPNPPWAAAKARVQSPEWTHTWANKQYKGPKPLLKAARNAERDHRQRP
jgi:hypothetical protein